MKLRKTVPGSLTPVTWMDGVGAQYCRGESPPFFAFFIKPLEHNFIPVPCHHWLLGSLQNEWWLPLGWWLTLLATAKAEVQSSLLKASPGPPGPAVGHSGPESRGSFCDIPSIQFFWR